MDVRHLTQSMVAGNGDRWTRSAQFIAVDSADQSTAVSPVYCHTYSDGHAVHNLLRWTMPVHRQPYRQSIATHIIQRALMKIKATQCTLGDSNFICILILIRTSIVLCIYTYQVQRVPRLESIRELRGVKMGCHGFFFHRALFLMSPKPALKSGLPRLRITKNPEFMRVVRLGIFSLLPHIRPTNPRTKARRADTERSAAMPCAARVLSCMASACTPLWGVGTRLNQLSTRIQVM